MDLIGLLGHRALTALLRMNGLKKHITDTKDSNDTEWDSKRGNNPRCPGGDVLSVKDVWTTVADDSVDSKVKMRARRNGRNLRSSSWGNRVYSPHLTPGSALTSTALDDSTPMLPQLQKLNDARLTLENNDMKVSDLQYCLPF